MLDTARADAVAESLELELSRVPACGACLWVVGHALRSGDAAEVRRVVRFVAPTLWGEGLEAPVRAALEAACARGVEDAHAAAAEVERFGPTSRVAKAVVRRLALQQLEDDHLRAEPTTANGFDAAGLSGVPEDEGGWLLTGWRPLLVGVDPRSQALDYARYLGVNFPFLRPSGEASLRFAERVAAELVGVDGEVPRERVAEGVELVDAGERRQLVEAYARRFPDVWSALCRDVGRETAERELVESAVRAAVDEQREPAPSILEPLEDPAAPTNPADALALGLFPEDVWTLDDAVAAAAAAAGPESGREGWERAIAAVARERLEAVHLRRIRTQASRLAAHLPLEGLPRASALLSRACNVVARDDAVAEDVAGRLLRNYVVRLVGPPLPGAARSTFVATPRPAAGPATGGGTTRPSRPSARERRDGG
jgi:hypothetical protein